MKKSTAMRSKWASYAHADGTFDFDALSDKQKEEFYAECETAGEISAPLTTAQRHLHASARRRGRPRKGSGTKIVSLSVEKSLLRRAEKLAKAQGVSRSDLFARGLKAVLAMAGAA